MAQKKALFICLGNICRSPIAEAVFIDEVKKAGEESKWEIDSAAIGSWHVGRSPESRAQATMKKHNLAYNNKARQIKTPDFKKYDYIFGMDEENIADLKERCPKDGTAKILMLGDFDPEGDRIIRDPYYDGGSEGFEKCYQQAVRSCKGFLEKVAQHKI
ncbi:low molecular weight phosphotyrosine protein phosphatase 1-like [Sitodiplosis mosellana]|uniref:low molecular weight phosphotyrosine protein phosphatase 1-like n=1 Tax=Sitodiplosis mosellana TaxID=263140 RepID=UPI002444C9C8|nr:low molecular weight phosphotyrosine protein phosphatase 1-like [Sitodiplosis mosellana]XP_055315811.1 low molecular weight phosphotyrosine protein phosphatase 1-like [Sitodiplosis mosellana]